MVTRKVTLQTVSRTSDWQKLVHDSEQRREGASRTRIQALGLIELRLPTNQISELTGLPRRKVNNLYHESDARQPTGRPKTAFRRILRDVGDHVVASLFLELLAQEEEDAFGPLTYPDTLAERVLSVIETLRCVMGEAYVDKRSWDGIVGLAVRQSKGQVYLAKCHTCELRFVVEQGMTEASCPHCQVRNELGHGLTPKTSTPVVTLIDPYSTAWSVSSPRRSSSQASKTPANESLVSYLAQSERLQVRTRQKLEAQSLEEVEALLIMQLSTAQVATLASLPARVVKDIARSMNIRSRSGARKASHQILLSNPLNHVAASVLCQLLWEQRAMEVSQDRTLGTSALRQLLNAMPLRARHLLSTLPLLQTYLSDEVMENIDWERIVEAVMDAERGRYGLVRCRVPTCRTSYLMDRTGEVATACPSCCIATSVTERTKPISGRVPVISPPGGLHHHDYQLRQTVDHTHPITRQTGSPWELAKRFRAILAHEEVA